MKCTINNIWFVKVLTLNDKPYEVIVKLKDNTLKNFYINDLAELPVSIKKFIVLTGLKEFYNSGNGYIQYIYDINNGL